MLKVKPEFVEQVRDARQPEDLYDSLQSAIELEHATIPLYLTAAYSIKDGYNAEARRIILSVAIEEMLHMTIAANVANAIGYRPVIDKPGFIPLYPGPLPMHIHEGLTASLQKVSRGLVYDVFMTIEEPEIPIKLRVKEIMALSLPITPPPKRFSTIGDFYDAVKNKLRELGDGIFRNPASPQVVDNTWFPASELFPVADVDSACRAIDVIVDQGEGTRASPLDRPGGRPAHYYRLAQIVYGRMLLEDTSTTEGWSYSGAAVPLNPAGVWNLYPDAKAVDYANGSRERNLVDRFNYSYTNLLRALHTTFNGKPQTLAQALGLMYEQRLLVSDIVSTPVTDTGYFATPTFEYTPVPT
jgi:hypothetical protein